MTLVRKLKKSDLQINVFNRQKKIGVDVTSLTGFLQTLGRRMKLTAGCSVALVDDRTMRAYNLQFRSTRGVTDVLSFPYEREDFEKEDSYLGDIMVSVETANRQKRESLLTELKVLSLHGLLHLLGHDHETDRGEMLKLEAQLRKEFKLL